jgi:hypothetical protein
MAETSNPTLPSLRLCKLIDGPPDVYLRCGRGFTKVNKSKKFFFEKKNQKTFAPLRAVFKTPGI